MLRVSVRNVTGRFWTLLLTALSVVLGTAFVAGSLVFTDSIDRTFDSAFDSLAQTTDVVVEGVEGAGAASGFGEGRAPLPLTLADEIAEVPGVEAVTPSIEGSAILVGDDGTAVRNGNAPSFGFAYRADDPTVELVDGRAPDGAGEVVVESLTLAASGLAVGDTTQLVVGPGPVDVEIVGEAEVDSSFGATLVLLDPDVAEGYYAPDGTVASFGVRGEGDPDQAALAAAITEVLPDVVAVTEESVTAQAQEDLETGLGFVNTFLLVVAGVALLVGAFIIFNVFSMLLARRTRELALLRAVGASSSQVLGAVVVEAVVVGLVGSVLGLGLGLAVAAGLQAFVATFGFDIDGGLPVATTTVVGTLLTGLLVTLVSAVLPAVRASRVAPVAALRDDVALPERQVRLRAALGVVLAVAGTAALLTGLFVDVQGPLYWVGAGVLGTFFGVAIAAPALSRPVVWLISLPTVALWGAVARLARQNAVRNPRRTAATASALMIGTALVGAATIVASSVNASVAEAIENELTADYVLSSGPTAQFATTVVEDAAEVEGVDLAVPVRPLALQVAPEGTDPAAAFAPTLAAGEPPGPEGAADPGAAEEAGSAEVVEVFAVAADPTELTQVVDVTIEAGQVSDEPGSLAVSRTVADDNGWGVGDVVLVRAGVAEPAELTVSAVYADNAALTAGAVVPAAVFDDAVPLAEQSDSQVLVLASEGADLAQVRDGLVEVVEPLLVVSVLDAEEFTSTQTSAINQILAFIAALLGLSILVALVGIVITLVLSVIERQREIGLLRAVGLSRVQLRRTVNLEGVATSVFGALLGISLGVVFGLSLQRALAADGLDTLSVPWLTLAGMLLAGVVVGILAAAAPAWWASRQDILRAIATE